MPKKNTGAQKWLFENVEKMLYTLGAKSSETAGMRFTAGLVRLQMLDASFKASHDKLAGALPYNRCSESELTALREKLSAWDWDYDDDDECFISFYPGG